jgi:asparagine synthase (glutamine-hydrolysing)
MFAFAIWDSRTQELFLARDRLGIKPLYYSVPDSDTFVFASQVKALLASGLVARKLSLSGLASYLDFGAVSDPLTIVEAVSALPAGHVAVLRDGRLKLNEYWTPPADDSASLAEERNVVADLRARLENTVAGHLISDAPLGVFLSGGLDSSTLAALAARHTDHLRTISVVFRERAYSEEPFIESVTRKLGSDHTRVTLGSSDLRDLLEEGFAAMDQPSFDGLNTFVISKAAHDAGLKVALSGLGADELFDGYGYRTRVIALERLRRLPTPLGRICAPAMRLLRLGSNDDKLRHWLSGSAAPGTSYELLRRLFLPDEVAKLVPAHPASDALPRPERVDLRSDPRRQVSVLDLTNYTRNVLLRDTDAMSMSNSLEIRVPYLDNQFVDWSLRLRAATSGTGKELLVRSVRDLLPDEIVGRRKQGFLLPIAPWMRRELKSEVGRTLAAPPEIAAALLEPLRVIDIWHEFENSRRGWLKPWALYALYKWAASVDEIVADTKTRGGIRAKGAIRRDSHQTSTK